MRQRLGGARLTALVAAGLAAAGLATATRVDALGQTGAPPPAEQAPEDETWLARQRMVAPAGRATLDQLATDHDLVIQREVGVSGYGLVEVPGSTPLALAAAALRADERVRGLAPHGRVRAAAAEGEAASWHLEALALPAPGADCAPITVAIADTGAGLSDGGALWAPEGLTGARLVEPWDFISGGDQADDDNGHGTHLASLVAGAEGAAPGASLMPLKVLDAEGEGLEIDLIEAIWWAVDGGADVLLLGLTMGPDYAPSEPLLEALSAARGAGVLVVAAAGNDGGEAPRWPAASAAALAVGASCLDRGGLERAPYSNRSPLVDLLAPGGCADRDRDGDGLVDGVIAETIDPATGGPDRWIYAGTSQAAALVAGLGARLMAAGARPEDARAVLLHTASEGGLAAPEVLAVAGTLPEEGYAPAYAYHAAITPFLRAERGLLTPAARLVVLDAGLRPAQGVEVEVLFRGATEAQVRCRPAADGVCVVSGPPLSAAPDTPAAWSVTAARVVLGGTVSFPPGGLLFASDPLEALALETRYDPSLTDALLALRWRAGPHPTLGPLAEAVAVPDLRTGGAHLPQALLLSAPALADAEVSRRLLDLGTGAAVSPAVLYRLPGQALDAPATLLALDGAGVANVDLDAARLLGPPPRRDRCRSCRFDSQPVRLAQGDLPTAGDTSQSGLQAILDGGGWRGTPEQLIRRFSNSDDPYSRDEGAEE